MGWVKGGFLIKVKFWESEQKKSMAIPEPR